MRQQLQPFLGEKYPFTGRVRKFGLRHSHIRGDEPTLMLKDAILYSSIAVPVDHVWLPIGKKFCKFDPRIGDLISFTGWVRQYYKIDPHKAKRSIDYDVRQVGRLLLIERGNGIDFQSYWGQMMQCGRFVAKWPAEVIKADTVGQGSLLGEAACIL